MKGWHVVLIALMCFPALTLLGCGQEDVSGIYQQVQPSASTVEVQLQDSGSWRWTETPAEGNNTSAKVVDEGLYTVEGNIVRAEGRWGEYRWVVDDDTLKSPDFSLKRVD